jgi:endonuclease/exonuclease/phosphatase family metal-dependent hydrolase
LDLRKLIWWAKRSFPQHQIS